MAADAERCDGSQPPAQKKRRAYHKKVRTGCATCKIRRLRCDETKPACNRCTSTGRNCDGYSGNSPSSMSSGSPPSGKHTKSYPIRAQKPQPAADTRLLLPRMDAREVRSYRYYLEVAAPGLSGFFDADFWLVEVPRVAHCHPAIWHAVCCLGTVHESEGGPTASGNMENALFGIEQFNMAIQSLRNSPNKTDNGVALTLSTIFTTMSVLGNKYGHAMMHLAAGMKLLQDLEGDDMKPVTKASSKLEKTPTAFDSVPISIAPIRNILLRMDMTQKSLKHGGLFGSAPPSEILENNIFRVWRSYTAPPPSTGTKSMLTPDVILAANRASESLLNGLVSDMQVLTCDQGPYAEITKVYASQEQSDALSRIMEGKGDRASEIARLATMQRPHTRGYRELAKALATFEAELEKPICGANRATRQQLMHAMRPLRLYLATCRIIMVLDPDNQAPQRMSSHAGLCQSILENAEAILNIDDTWLELENGTRVAFTSNSMCLDALFMTAHSSPSLAQRRYAADLMRRPKSEGLWPTLMASKLADAVLAREMEALGEYRHEASLQAQQRLESAPEPGPEVTQHQYRTSEEAEGSEECYSGDYYEEDSPHGLHRIRTLIVKLDNGRRAHMTLQTWGESIQGLPGRDSILEW